MTTTETQPYTLFRAEVMRTRQLSPHMRRITFGGPDLAGCASAGLDQRIKLFLPQQGQSEPDVPTGADWFTEYRAMPDDRRPFMRTFTIADLRVAEHEMDVDFVLHGGHGDESGPASRFAAAAQPGDRVAILGPDVRHSPIVGYEYQPGADTDWTLLAGDETALPAIAAILSTLPADRQALVFLEVESAREMRPLDCASNVHVTWLSRGGAPAVGGGLLCEAITRTTFPTGRPYAWLASESSAVVGLRRHLVNERGVDKKDVYFAGYWLLGGPIE